MEQNEVKLRKGEIARKKIFSCAIDLFMEKGFENVKLSDICDAAEIAIGTFYYYYPSKEAIFLEYASLSDEMTEDFAASLQCSSYAERLIALLVHEITMFSNVGMDMGNSCLTAFLKHRISTTMELDRVLYSHVIKTLEDGVACGEFSENLDARLAASFLRYLLGGLTLRWTCSKGNFDIDEEIHSMAHSFVDTIKRK